MMNLIYQEATRENIPDLVNLLFDDELGADREDNSVPLNSRYMDAFLSINKDVNNELCVAKNNGQLVGMLQLT